MYWPSSWMLAVWTPSVTVSVPLRLLAASVKWAAFLRAWRALWPSHDLALVGLRRHRGGVLRKSAHSVNKRLWEMSDIVNVLGLGRPRHE